MVDNIEDSNAFSESLPKSPPTEETIRINVPEITPNLSNSTEEDMSKSPPTVVNADLDVNSASHGNDESIRTDNKSDPEIRSHPSPSCSTAVESTKRLNDSDSSDDELHASKKKRKETDGNESDVIVIADSPSNLDSMQHPLSIVRGDDEEWAEFMDEFKAVIETIDLVSDDEADDIGDDSGDDDEEEDEIQLDLDARLEALSTTGNKNGKAVLDDNVCVHPDIHRFEAPSSRRCGIHVQSVLWNIR